MDRIRKALSFVAELISRFWPASKDEAKLLEELGAAYGDDENASEDLTDNEA